MSSIPIKIDPILNHICPTILLATDAHLGGAWGGVRPHDSIIKRGHVRCVMDINQSPVLAALGVGVFFYGVPYFIWVVI